MEEHFGSWLTPLADALPPGLRSFVDVHLLFAFGVVALLGVLVWRSSRRLTLVPTSGLQSVGEWAYEGLMGLARGILGEEADHYGWIMGSFFIYILFLNLTGLIPGFLSPTARLNTTVALALCSITIAQVVGIQRNGVRYFTRFFICTKGGIPVFPQPLKIIEEVIKPVSLSMRLFGNVLGDDTAIAAFAALGAGALTLIFNPGAAGASALMRFGFGPAGLALGVGITGVMIAMAVLVAFIQALVFSLLTGAYILFALEME
jgi:F-type H+-transporting ATPase subunit a